MELDVKVLYRENVWADKISQKHEERTGNRIKYKQETMWVKSRDTSRTLKKNWEIQSRFSEKCKSLWLGIADVRVILDKKIRKMQKKVLIKLTLHTFWDKRTNIKTLLPRVFPRFWNTLLVLSSALCVTSLCIDWLLQLVWFFANDT